MIKVGRYKIIFGSMFWTQTQVPVTIRRFLCFSIIREANPNDIDTKQRFHLGTPMQYEGKKYYYYRAGSAIHIGNATTHEGNTQ